MERAGLVLIIPSDYPILERGDELAALLDAVGDINLAALRLGTAGHKREAMIKRGDFLREIGHAREISVLIDDHPSIAQEIGLDGVHLTRPDAKALRDARKVLGNDAVIGVHSGASRHDGMVLGEIGVDYVAYGPLQDLGLDEEVAPAELFEWWSQMIELPLVAEGGLDENTIATIKDYVDFIALGDEVFGATEPLTALQSRLAIL